MGLPFAGGTGSGLLQHLVDLLEGKTLGLGDEEVGEEDCMHISKVSTSLFSVLDLQEMQHKLPHRKNTFDPS